MIHLVAKHFHNSGFMLGIEDVMMNKRWLALLSSFTFSWGRKEVQMIIIQCEEWLLENYAQRVMRISGKASWKRGNLSESLKKEKGEMAA